MMDNILIYYYFLSFLSLKEQVRHYFTSKPPMVMSHFAKSFIPHRKFVKRVLDAYTKYMISGECLGQSIIFLLRK